MRIKSNILGIIVLIIIFGGIAVSAALNMWDTSSNKSNGGDRYLAGTLNSEEDHEHEEEDHEHEDHERSGARRVNGETTFDQVIDWGVTKENIEDVIRGETPADGMTIRDYCRQEGILFPSVKDRLNSIIDK